MTNTIITTKHELDQFYTSPTVAKHCLSVLMDTLQYKPDVFIEPSCGDGSFLNILPDNKIGYDLDPNGHNMIQCDFFDTDDQQLNQSTVYVGNPPFGKSANLAIKFFNHCANNRNATHIAFIIPNTFNKVSVQNKLSLDFHLIHTEYIPNNSFILNDQPYNVPCSFQIWERQSPPRIKITPPYNRWFELVTDQSQVDFCLRRVGGKSGQILEGFNHSKSSTYFIKSKVPNLKQLLNQIDFSPIVNNTAGIKSLSITEILLELNKLS